MEPIFISLGSDCTVANFLRDSDKRNFALPFDWMVTYNGVCDIIQNNLKDMKSTLIQAAFTELGQSKDLHSVPTFDDLMNCTKNNPISWNINELLSRGH